MAKLTSNRAPSSTGPRAPSPPLGATESIAESPTEHSSTETLDTLSYSRPDEATTNETEFSTPSAEPIEEAQAASLVESSSASSLSPPPSLEIDSELVETPQDLGSDEPDDAPSEHLIFLDAQALDFSAQDSSSDHAAELSPTSKDAMAAGAETIAIEAPTIAQAPTPVSTTPPPTIIHESDSNIAEIEEEDAQIDDETRHNQTALVPSASDSSLHTPKKTPHFAQETTYDVSVASETSSTTAETNSASNALEAPPAADTDADSSPTSTSPSKASADSPNTSKRRAERNLSDIIGTRSPLSIEARRKIKPSASTSSPSNRHSIAIDSPAAVRLASSASGEILSPSGSPVAWNPKARPASGQIEIGDYSSISPTGKLQASSGSSGSGTGLSNSTPMRHSKSHFFSGLLSNGKSKKDKEKDKEGKEPKEKKDKDKSKKHKDKKSKHASVDFQALSPPSKGKIVPITPYTMEQIMHSTNVAKPDTTMSESATIRPFLPIAPLDPSVLDLPIQPIPTYSQAHRRSSSPSGMPIDRPVPAAVAGLQKEYSEPHSAPSSVKKSKKKQRGSEKVAAPVPVAAPVVESSGGRSRSNSEAARIPVPHEKVKSKSKSNKNVYFAGGSQED